MHKDVGVRMINNKEKRVWEKYIRNHVTAFPINGVYIWLKNKNIKYQIFDNKMRDTDDSKSHHLIIYTCAKRRNLKTKLFLFSNLLILIVVN